MERSLSPEILDALPASDIRARRSRRDLRRLNRFLGNDRWWHDVIASRIPRGCHVLELGAGDGSFPLLPARRVDGLDHLPPPAGWPRTARWWRGSIQDFEAWNHYEAVIGNLVFHHLTRRELQELGTRLTPHVRIIAASEPRRARRFAWGFRLLAVLLGANDVTRHDGRVSIHAGFRGDELPQALGLSRPAWQWQVQETWRGAYRLWAANVAAMEPARAGDVTLLPR